MNFLNSDKNFSSYDSQVHVNSTSTVPPGCIPPLIRGLSLEDSMKSASLSTSKHRPHPLCMRINYGFNDTSSLDSIFSQSTILNQKNITNNVLTTPATTTTPATNDKSNRMKSSTLPNVIKIVRKNYDTTTLDVVGGKNHQYEKKKHLKCDPELIAQQMTLIELNYFQAIEPDEFYTLKWNSKEKLQYAPNIVASTRWFNQIIFWVQKDILNEKSLSKRTEILSHFIRIAKKLVDLNNFSSAMAIVSGLHVQCIYRLDATWSNLSSRDRHTFRKLASLFSQEQNYMNLRSAVDNARLPCIPYLGVYLSDLTFIDVVPTTTSSSSSTSTSTSSNHQHGSWSSQTKQNRINNILRIIANFQQSSYSFIRNESIASYLEGQRYIEELQRFMEDANYKLSLQIEPPPLPPSLMAPPTSLSSSSPNLLRQDDVDAGGGRVPQPKYSFLSNHNNSNHLLKPIPIYNNNNNHNGTTNMNTTTTTTTTTTLSSPKLTITSSLSGKKTPPTLSNKAPAPMITMSQPKKKQSKSNPTMMTTSLGHLLEQPPQPPPPMIPPPPPRTPTHTTTTTTTNAIKQINPSYDSIQRPRKKRSTPPPPPPPLRPINTHRRLSSWEGFGSLSGDNHTTTSTVDKIENKSGVYISINTTTNTTNTTTTSSINSSSNSRKNQFLTPSPNLNRNMKLSVNKM
ncbi:unnamed protein product [Schistosoma turkestanicum]|nr:unnamed protein product [Schistosoma turkestanicum]